MFFAQIIKLNLQAFNLTILSCIKNYLTCFIICSRKILKNKKFRYLVFEKYVF